MDHQKAADIFKGTEQGVDPFLLAGHGDGGVQCEAVDHIEHGKEGGISQQHAKSQRIDGFDAQREEPEIHLEEICGQYERHIDAEERCRGKQKRLHDIRKGNPGYRCDCVISGPLPRPADKQNIQQQGGSAADNIEQSKSVYDRHRKSLRVLPRDRAIELHEFDADRVTDGGEKGQRGRQHANDEQNPVSALAGLERDTGVRLSDDRSKKAQSEQQFCNRDHQQEETDEAHQTGNVLNQPDLV